MKKIKTGFVIAVLFVVTNLFGQATETQLEKNDNDKKTTQTYLDLMVNVVSTNIHYGGSNSMLNDYKKPGKGIQAGVSLQAGITPAFSLASELYFMRKGGTLKANNPLTTSESTLRLNTLELPVLARFQLGKFYMNAGPSIAYHLSGNEKTNDQSTKLSFNNSSEGYKRFDAGIQMGGGVAFPLKQKRIALDIRYSYGMTNMSYGKEMYNRALMISVHFSKAWKTNPPGRR